MNAKRVDTSGSAAQPHLGEFALQQGVDHGRLSGAHVPQDRHAEFKGQYLLIHGSLSLLKEWVVERCPR